MRGKVASAIGTLGVVLVVLAAAETMGLNWGAPSVTEECAAKGDPSHHVEVTATRLGGLPSNYANRMDVVWFISSKMNGSKTMETGRFASDGTVHCGSEVRISARVHAKAVKVTCLVRVDGVPAKGDHNKVGSCRVRYTVK